MSRWPLKVYPSLKAAMEDQGVQSFFDLRVGTVYPALEYFANRETLLNLGPKYWAATQGSRWPFFVVLPGKTFWCPDQCAYSSQSGYHGDGWDVTGYPTAISCSPSINAMGIYHGYVTNGFVTEDCEGRKFTDAGELIK
jgi:hypothetical protein